MTNSLLVPFAGNVIQVDTNHAGLASAIQLHFGAQAGVQNSTAASYNITAISDVEFSMSRNGSDLFSKLQFEQVLFHLMQDGLGQLNSAARSSLVFHAAALAHQQRGLLLCGKSGSGKSTLAAWLLSNQFDYLTDEVVSRPLSETYITGFSRSLVLKKGSAFIWESCQDSPDILKFKNGVAWIPAPVLGALECIEQVAPRLLVFPTYKKDSDFQVESLSNAKALFNLMQVLVNARNLPDHGMTASSQLVRNVRSFKLTYSNVEQAGEWLHKTISMI